MKAYHGDPAVKEKYLARVRAHRVADQLVQGNGYWNGGKGCVVDCTIHGDSYKAYETELGIPVCIAWLQARLFEALPEADARVWPEKFLAAITEGADLGGVLDRWLHWLLVDPVDGVIRLAKTDRTRDAVAAVAGLYERKIEGKEVSREDWKKSATYSDAGVAAVAYAAAYAGAYAGAYAYVGTAATATASGDATYATVIEYAVAADIRAREKARIRQSEKLLELLANAPVV